MNINFGIIKDGIITAPVAMMSNFNGVGAWHTLSDDERATYGWYPCDVVNEGYDERSQIRSTQPILEFDGERITATYVIVNKSIDAIRNDALDKLAALRYQAEIGGIVTTGGIKQATTRTERLLLSDKLAFMRANASVNTTMWKASGEWHELTTAELSELQMLIGIHVDKCYAAEHAACSAIIAAVDIGAILAIDSAGQFDSLLAS